MAMLHADKKATEAALVASKAEAAAVRMHDTSPQSSLRALMHQRTQAWAAERTTLRKECDELREFKERMHLEVRSIVLLQKGVLQVASNAHAAFNYPLQGECDKVTFIMLSIIMIAGVL